MGKESCTQKMVLEGHSSVTLKKPLLVCSGLLEDGASAMRHSTMSQ